MHTPRAGFQRHIIAKGEQNFSILIEGMSRFHALQELSLTAEKFSPQGETRYLFDLGLHRLGDQVYFVIARLEEGVIVVRMNRHRKAGGQSPRRRRPDDDGDIASCQFREFLGGFFKGISHIDGRGCFIFVLNFSGGKSRLAVDAPEDRLAPLVDVPILHHFRK